MNCSKCDNNVDLKYSKSKETEMLENYWWCEDCGRVDPTNRLVLTTVGWNCTGYNLTPIRVPIDFKIDPQWKKVIHVDSDSMTIELIGDKNE